MPAAKFNWTQKIEDEILEGLMSGVPLTKICQRPHMPSIATVFRCEDRIPGLTEKISRARERSADHFSHEILEIGDELTVIEVPSPDGGVTLRVDPGAVQRNKLRIDTRIKLMQMLKRKTYGEKSEVALSGNDGGPLELIVKHIGSDGE
jgi:hypothetical protein